jgi:hypothetical protein
MTVERIGTEGIDLLTIRASELEGSILDGRGGEDILELASGSFWGEFDFRTVASFTGIERIRGINSSHIVIFSSEQIQGIKSFENPNGGDFSLRVEGSNVDFRNKALGNGIDLQIVTSGATFVVNDLQVAMAVDGSSVTGETLVVEGVILTDTERRALHSHGINRVQDATGTVTEDLTGPSILGIKSDVTVAPGLRWRPGAEVSVSEDIGLYSMRIELDQSHWNLEMLNMDQSGSVRVESDEWSQWITINGRVVAEASLYSLSSFSFYFNANATAADAQEILRSIIYESIGSTVPAGSNKLKIEITDWFLNRTHAEVNINYLNQAPTDIWLDYGTIYSDSTVEWDSYVNASDPNNGEKFTFTLLDDANGYFKIDSYEYGSSLRLAKSPIRQESFTIKIRVTDKGGLFLDRTFVLPVMYVSSDVDPDEVIYDEVIEGTDSFDGLTGSGADDKLLGYNGDDRLKGHRGRDHLDGGNDSDRLWGGAGNDTLKGGAGRDFFVFDTKPHKGTNKDRIVDFSVKDDGIWLENKVFTKLGKSGSEKKPAQLKKGFFTIGSKAKDKDDYVIYDKAKGVLYYDADGSGRGKAVEIATLSKKLAMTYKDFFVI